MMRALLQVVAIALAACATWQPPPGVDDTAIARRLADVGVDGITTNRPEWLREQLK